MDKAQLYVFIGIGGIVVFLALIFAGIIPGLPGEETKPATITFWGFQNRETWQEIFKRYEIERPNIKVNYIQKNPASFEDDFVNTLARTQTPDVIMFPAEYIEKHANKLTPAPANLMSERQLKEEQVDAAQMFWSSARKSIIGVPMTADALVLYSNNNLFAKEFILSPPLTWDKALLYAQKLTKKDAAGNILVAGIGMGRARNIKHADDALTALFLQFGDQIADSSGQIVFGNPVSRGGVEVMPAESALQFFTDFSNPKKSSHSWSYSLPEAQEMFLTGKLGMYIGYISEYAEIKAKNPHLDVSVSLFPQLTGASRPTTFGKLSLLSVSRTSRNQVAAWDFVQFATSPKILMIFANTAGNVAPRRDLLGEYDKEAARSVFAKSIFYLTLWPNPDPPAVQNIFRIMIEEVAFGQKTIGNAIRDAKTLLINIVKAQ